MGETIHRDRLFDKSEIRMTLILILIIIAMTVAGSYPEYSRYYDHLQSITESGKSPASNLPYSSGFLLLMLIALCGVILFYIFNHRSVIYGKDGIRLWRKLPRRVLEIPISDVDLVRAVLFTPASKTIELPNGLEETEGVELWLGGVPAGAMLKGIAVVTKSGKKYVLFVKDPKATLEKLKGHYAVEA